MLFNQARNITAVISPLNQRVSYVWSEYRLLGYVDGLGNRSSLNYSDAGDGTARLRSITDARQGCYTPIERPGSDSADRSVGADGRLIWDDNSNRTVLIDPLGGRSSFVYDSRGQVTAWTDPTGNRTSIAYNSTGQISSLSDPLRRRLSLTYDSFDQLQARRDPLNRLRRASTMR